MSTGLPNMYSRNWTPAFITLSRGNGPDFDRTKCFIHDLNIQDAVTVLGRVTEEPKKILV